MGPKTRSKYFGKAIYLPCPDKHIEIFYNNGSVHRDPVLIRSNKMQHYAGIYLLQVYSTCFGRPSRSSSGIPKILTAASGTGHIT